MTVNHTGNHKTGSGDLLAATVRPQTTMETDGTYGVGTDIFPGTYRSAGASSEGESDCSRAIQPTEIRRS